MGVLATHNTIYLLSSTTVGMQTADGAQTLYTVPTGMKCIVTHCIVRTTTGSLAGGTDFDFGDGANKDTWKNTVDLSGMTGTGTQYYVVESNNTIYTIFDAADAFGVKPVTGSTADVDAVIDVFGYLYSV